MKVFTLFLVICICSTIVNIANSQTTQDKQGNLISQRIRSIRESLRSRVAVDSNKTKPVVAENEDDDDDAWNIGSFFGDITTKMGSFFKGAVDNLFECVDDVFGCLNPNDEKKKKKKKEEKPEPKPHTTGDSEQGGAGGIKPTTDPVTKATPEVVTTKPTAPASSTSRAAATVSAASTQSPISTPAPAPATQSATSASTSQSTGS